MRRLLPLPTARLPLPSSTDPAHLRAPRRQQFPAADLALRSYHLHTKKLLQVSKNLNTARNDLVGDNQVQTHFDYAPSQSATIGVPV